MSVKKKVYRLATDNFVIELDSIGRAYSLRRGAEGPQLLVASDSPIFTIGVGETLIPLSRLTWMRDESTLIAAGADDRIGATFQMLKRSSHLTFQLKDLRGVTGRLTLTLRLELAITGCAFGTYAGTLPWNIG